MYRSFGLPAGVFLIVAVVWSLRSLQGLMLPGMVSDHILTAARLPHKSEESKYSSSKASQMKNLAIPRDPPKETKKDFNFQTRNKYLDVRDLTEPVPSSAEDIECVKHSFGDTVKICIHKNDLISKKIKRHGTWETAIQKQLFQAFKEYPSADFLDVGANIGVFSLLVASLGHKVVAVEPNPDNIIRIHKASHLSGVADRITVVANAVLDQRKEVHLAVQRSNIGGSPVFDDKIHVYFKKPFHVLTTLNVTSILLDDLLSTLQATHTAIMKVDIEGSEPLAFKNASRLLDQINIPYIFMEWAFCNRLLDNQSSRQNVQDLLTLMEERGYSAFLDLSSRQPLSSETMSAWPFNIVWKKEVTK